MSQRSRSDADTYPSTAIRLRREGQRLVQAIRVGGLASALLLACDHERVDLGGPGAGGSGVIPVAMSAGSAAVPELPGSMFLQSRPQAVPASRVIESPSPRVPSLDGLTTLPQLLPAISGGTLAVAADGSSAVAADPDRDLVYLVDIAAETTRIVTLPTGSEPGRVVLDDSGHAHVVLRSAGQLARVALETASAQLSEPVCQYPRGLAFNPATRSVHVACADDQLVQLSADTYDVVERTHSPASDLRDVVLDAGGKLSVSRFRDASLWLPERDPAEIILPELPWPRVDASQSSSEPARWLSTQATFAYRTVSAVDGTLWMLHERAQVDALEGDSYLGAKNQCGAPVQPALTQIDPDTGEIRVSLQLHGVSAPAVDLAFSPNGSWVAVATPSAFAAGRASVQLHRLPALIDEARIEPQINAEFPPSAELLCVPPIFMELALETQAVAVAFDGNDVLYIQSRFPTRLHVVQVEPLANTGDGPGTPSEKLVAMNELPTRDLGHEWFHAELADSRVSCAACHAEGLDDAHVWQTSKGPRRTSNLRGGLSLTAPFTWDGAHTSLDSAIMRFSNALVPPAAISSIGQWLDKLSALSVRSPRAEDELAAQAGQALFESDRLGCASCHAGAQLTNNQTTDVGTGGPFQVPSLRGLALRAPYMHDGCAKDLQALFTAASCGGAQHTLHDLEAGEAASLRAYLRSL